MTPVRKATGEVSMLSLLASLESHQLWNDAKMEGVQAYLQTSKYLYTEPELRAFLGLKD